MTNVQLLIIDPQKDFCDGPSNGSLAVPGAHEDMLRLATMIDRIGRKLSDIHVTLDSHHTLDIAHPTWWMGSDGSAPAPFTIISVDDVESGVWIPRAPAYRRHALEYVKALAAAGNYPLCIWPMHCRIGSPGHAVHDELFTALTSWETTRFGVVDYISKGSNILTEHYSALKAEVPDPRDPTTSLNTNLIEALSRADKVGVGGEALSHCFRATVTDVVDNIDPDMVKKFYLLRDATSPVPGFEAPAEAFVQDMIDRGMQLSTTTTFLA